MVAEAGAGLGQFLIQRVNLSLHGGEVNFLFLLKCVDIAGDVEVIAVLGNLFGRRQMDGVAGRRRR